LEDSLVRAQELDSLSDRCDFSIYSGSKILITGGAGMIGSWLATSLIKIPSYRDAIDLTVLSRRSAPYNLRDIWDMPNFSYMQTSVEEAKLENYDFIFHGASVASPTQYQDSEKIFQANVKGAELLIQASPTLKQFVYLSSGEVYGNSPPFQMKENFIGSFAENLHRSSYPKSKLAAEEFIYQESMISNFKSKIIRLFHTFGPGLSPEDGRSFADFVWAIANGKPPVLHSPGDQVRAFLYLEDSVAGILNATEQKRSVTVNVGSDIPLSIRNFAEIACKVSNLDIGPLFDFDQKTAEQSPIGISVPSNELLKSFGWAQRYSIEEALIRTIHWAKSVGL
jgi:UDP-glucuronate decarboxylase